MKTAFSILASALLGLAFTGSSSAGETRAGSFQEITPAVAQAVEKGLEYLVRTQGADGSWGPQYPTAMTSLAGLALLAGGNTPNEGKYAAGVRGALKFLLRHRDQSGFIGTADESGRSMHGHGFAMLFLAEAYGMAPEEEMGRALRGALVKAVELTAGCQSDPGGWTYEPVKGGDEGSITITQVQGLRAARNAGIEVPAKTILKGIDYVRKSQNADGSIRYQSTSSGQGTVALTAAGAAVFMSAGLYDESPTRKAVEYLRMHLAPGGRTGHDLYTHLYASQVMFQVGGEEWEKYYAAMRPRLLESQNSDGSWEQEYGGAYATAISCLILQIPYRYLPIFQR